MRDRSKEKMPHPESPSESRSSQQSAAIDRSPAVDVDKVLETCLTPPTDDVQDIREAAAEVAPAEHVLIDSVNDVLAPLPEILPQVMPPPVVKERVFNRIARDSEEGSLVLPAPLRKNERKKGD